MAAVSEKPRAGAARSSNVGSRSQPRRRGGRRLAIVACGLLLVYLTPTIVSLTALRDVPLRMAFDGIDGSIRSDAASLGWFSPVEYRGIEVFDADGLLVLRVPKATLDRTPLQLLSNRKRLGKVAIERPELRVVARNDGSNAEDTFLPWWNQPSSGRVELELQIADGVIALDDEASGQKWDIRTIAASLQLAGDDTDPANWSAEGTVTEGEQTGHFAASSAFDSKNTIRLRTEKIPLAMIRWLVARQYQDLQLSGELTSDVVWRSADSGRQTTPAEAGQTTAPSFAGTIGLKNLSLAGGPLQGDALRLTNLSFQSNGSFEGEDLHLKELKAECELGKLAAAGTIPAAVPRDRKEWEALLHEQFSLEGSLDVARLTQMLRNSLHIRPDTQLTRGTVRLSIASNPGADEHRWQAHLEAASLAANRAGKPVRWENPVIVNVAVRETNAGIIADSVQCSTDFLQINGQGTPEDFAANLVFDLNRLKAELGQLIELDQLQFAGTGQAQIQWRRDGAGTFRTAASARLKDFALTTGPAAVWRETDLTAELEAAGQMPAAMIEKLDRAVLRVAAAAPGSTPDKLDINLREPIVATNKAGASAIERWPVLIHCSGNAIPWQTRLAPWIDLRGLDLIGGADVHANLTWSPPSFAVHSLQGAVTQRDLGPLTFSIQGSYSEPTDAIRIDNAQVHLDAIEVRAAGRIAAVHTRPEIDLSGEAVYDWPRISTLLAPRFGTNIRIEGRESRPFAVRGPMAVLANGGSQTGAIAASQPMADPLVWLKPLSAHAAVGWQRADVFGLHLEQGNVAAELRDGVVRIEPVEFAVSAGRVRLAPQVILSPSPIQLTQGRGKVIDRVRVTPAMTASWLKYVAPAVAEATETQGEVSLDLEGAVIPLGKPEAVTASGRLEIHSLQVSPGPTARAVILLAEQIRALTEKRPPPLELGRNPILLKVSGQLVDFHMADGRVHHQGMMLDIGNVTVRTHGWVAFDESIGLVAEVPVKANWFGNNAPPAALKDQTLQIPINGTLRRPQVDPRAMQQVVALFAQNAARDLIQGQINKQLDRLLQPK